MTFGQWLRAKLYDKRINNAELARRVGVSATHIGNIVKDRAPNTKKGTSGPTLEMTDKIAVALGIPKDEARIAAGYLPERPTSPGPPQTFSELKTILENLGISDLSFFEEHKFQEATPGQLQDILDAVQLAVRITFERQHKRGPGRDDSHELRR